jgi:hypothetical protein
MLTLTKQTRGDTAHITLYIYIYLWMLLRLPRLYICSSIYFIARADASKTNCAASSSDYAFCSELLSRCKYAPLRICPPGPFAIYLASSLVRFVCYWLMHTLLVVIAIDFGCKLTGNWLVWRFRCARLGGLYAMLANTRRSS